MNPLSSMKYIKYSFEKNVCVHRNPAFAKFAELVPFENALQLDLLSYIFFHRYS